MQLLAGAADCISITVQSLCVELDSLHICHMIQAGQTAGCFGMCVAAGAI